MAQKEYERLEDDEIVKLVDQNVRTSTGYSASDLSKEREGAGLLQRQIPNTAARR